MKIKINRAILVATLFLPITCLAVFYTALNDLECMYIAFALYSVNLIPVALYAVIKGPQILEENGYKVNKTMPKGSSEQFRRFSELEKIKDDVLPQEYNAKFVEEQALWSGVPSTHKIFNKWDALNIPLGIYLVVFSSIWLNYTRYAPKIFMMFGVLMIIIGVYWIFGRIFMRYSSKKKISYHIYGDKIEIRDSQKDIVRVLAFSEIKRIKVEVDGKGFGSVYFNRYSCSPIDLFENSGFSIVDSQLFAFYDVEDATTIIEILKSSVNTKTEFVEKKKRR